MQYYSFAILYYHLDSVYLHHEIRNKAVANNKQEKEEKENKSLTGISPEFADAIKTLQVSQVQIAKRLYPNDWKEGDEAQKRKLTGRLRNKLDGSGKLTNEELFQIQNIVIELGEAMITAAKKSIAETAERRKKKLKELMQYWDGEEEDAE